MSVNRTMLFLGLTVVLFAGRLVYSQAIHVPTTAVTRTEPSNTEHATSARISLAEGQNNTSSNIIWMPTRKMGGDATKIENFFGSNQATPPLTQVASNYNGASSSATVSANLVSLIFNSGWQAIVATNIQAGSAGVTDVTQGTVPTLSANAAGQATQNMLYGGTLAFIADLPLLFYGPKIGQPGGLGFELDAVSREGVDIQNFKTGTSTSVNSPPSHHATQLESYFVYNAINPPSGSSSGFAGSVFLGANYGYSYTSHGYARDYGFGPRVNNDLGQVSAGILITNVAKISVSRAFGPSQTYMDSTSLAKTKVNNFKAWSFGITYQSASPAPKT